jgi:hypothetical protein
MKEAGPRSERREQHKKKEVNGGVVDAQKGKYQLRKARG